MTVSLEPIDNENLEEIVRLLERRNRTIPAYTRWKYGGSSAAVPRGYLARIGGVAVGCFGRLPRCLTMLAAGDTLPCGWFADWYVVPSARGRGVGQALLEAVTSCGTPVFGHPGSAAAQTLCRRLGYRDLGFQSRLRLVLRSWLYERARTRYASKALARTLVGHLRSWVSRCDSVAHHRNSDESLAAEFIDKTAWGQWIAKQPVAPGVRRVWGQWADEELSIVFLDDNWAGVGTCRLVAYAHGPGGRRFESWRRFFSYSAGQGICYLEHFTTRPIEDRVWRAAGAWRVGESSVLVSAPRHCFRTVDLQGWDRENFTWRAAVPAAGALP